MEKNPNQVGSYPYPPPQYTPYPNAPQSEPSVISYPHPHPHPHQHPQLQPQPVGFVQPLAQVVIHTNPPVGPTPTLIMCPSCHQNVQTKLEYEPATRTHLASLALCLLGCYLCCCIPYCMDSCQNGNHYCPNCGAFIGTYVA